MPVAATSNNSTQSSSGAAGLLNLVAAQPSSGNIAEQFKSLLTQLGGGQNGTPSKLTQQQISDLLLKEQQAGGANATATAGSADLAQLEIKIKVLLNANTAAAKATTATDSTTDPSADLIAEIAALMQKFPALQQVFTGNINTQQLQSISDALAKSGPNNPPDFSGLQLPNDLKTQLNALAQDTKASAAFQDAAQQIAAQPTLAAAIPDALQNFSALLQQNASANAAANSGLLQSNNIGLQPSTAQNITNNAANTVQAANDKTNIGGKSRPQGLLRSLDQGLQAAQTSNTTAGAALKDSDADDTSGGNLGAALQNSANAQTTANAASTETTAPFFTLTTNASPSLTAEQSNALLQTGKAGLSLGGVSDAYSAQLASNNAAATANPAIQLAVQMQRNAQLNNNNFIMQLHPEELGRIQVEMKFDGNKLQTKITADKQETLNSLKQDSGTLTRALQNAGLQTDAGSMEFSLNSSQQQYAGQSQKNNTGDQFGTLLASNSIDETAAAPASSSQWMTLGTGHVDVRL